jgi:hypothetical protein
MFVLCFNLTYSAILCLEQKDTPLGEQTVVLFDS